MDDDIPDDELEAWDDVKDCELDPSRVKEARRVEMKYVQHHKVYTYAPISEYR